MEFLQYFGPVFAPLAISLLIGGTIGGLLLGATPGLSPTMAVALLIPFTFQMEAVNGLILLGAVYTATVAGGAVSAILLRIPGAPANIATTLDGYPMAARGDGMRALQLAFLASGFGGVLGVGILIFLTPVLSQWALAFGPSHLFWLAILGVTIIGSLDSGSVVKGLLSGSIGLWLATIGYDDIQGVERFVFADALTGGINVIAALIGLFAIPQILDMFEVGRERRDITSFETRAHPVGAALREMLRFPRAMTIGSVVGTFIGLIPGVGGQIAGLVSYDQAKKFSPEREQFGAGHPEGVVAAETANNAMVGPSLVPLLTLGIPGSPTAAVLLGGLLIHGIFPGSDLFENYPHVAWVFINSMLIGQILMVIFGLMLARTAANVAKVPPAVMAGAVMVLAVFGSYSVQQSYGDVMVMATLGVGMYFLQKFGFSAAPLVLGLILGPLAETNYLQGSLIAGATDGMFSYFFTGALNIALIAFCVGSIGYSLIMESRRSNAVLDPTARSNQNNAARDRGTASKTAGILPGVVTLAFATGVAWISFTVDEPDAYLFPQVLASSLLLLAIVNLALGWIQPSKPKLDWPLLQKLIPGLLCVLVYVFWAAEGLGFYAAGFLAMFLIYSLYDPTRLSAGALSKRLVVTAGFIGVIFLLFSGLLQVFTPTGILF